MVGMVDGPHLRESATIGVKAFISVIPSASVGN
jgi:hypothetical protein